MKLAPIIDAYFAPKSADGLIEFESTLQSLIQSFLASDRVGVSTRLDDLSTDYAQTALPTQACTLRHYADFLKTKVVPYAINVSNPNCIGHMTSAIPRFHAALSRLVTMLNQNMVKTETSHALTLIERQVIAMMHRLLFEESESYYETNAQNKSSTLGIVTSGGTLANVTSLWLARNNALGISPSQPAGFNQSIRAQGYKGAAIVGSSLMHYSMLKAASILGLGHEDVLCVPINSRGSISLEDVTKTLRRCRDEKRLVVALVGIAGSTETGSVDDLGALAEIAQTHNIHFHVDAAWGGALMFSDMHRAKLKGIEHADTITICGHKQLYLPQGSSMVLCRDAGSVTSIRTLARYQARGDSHDLGKHSLEGSRPAACLYWHASLHLLGKAGYEALVDRGIALAAELSALIRANDSFELLEDAQTNIVAYRFRPLKFREGDTSTSEAVSELNALNRTLQEELLHQGQSLISWTTVKRRVDRGQSIVALRAVLANPLTTQDHLAAILKKQEELGHMLARGRDF